MSVAGSPPARAEVADGRGLAPAFAAARARLGLVALLFALAAGGFSLVWFQRLP